MLSILEDMDLSSIETGRKGQQAEIKRKNFLT